jgi:hypothetical protein
MKALTFTGLLLLCLVVGKYSNTASTGSSNIHKPTDTTFLVKNHSADYYQVVYIEKNRSSSAYKDLLNFRLDSNENEEYHENCNALYKKAVSGAKKYKMNGLPRLWLPVYNYAGKYYLYSPSEDGIQGRLMLTDTTVCFMYMDGYYPEQILSATNQGEKNWSLNVFSLINGRHRIIVHTVDPKTHLAVWGNLNRGDNRYQLYVPREYANNFDMVVNSNRGNVKVGEFNFDEIDFQKLLKNR